jgi:hypothetical protein
MTADTSEILFNARQRFDRFEAEFYGHEGKSVPLSRTVLNAYRKKLSDAKIFRQLATGKRGTLNDLSRYFSKEKGLTLDYVIPESVKQAALLNGKATAMYCMEFDVEPAAYTVDTELGPLELKKLEIWYEYTVTPKA